MVGDVKAMKSSIVTLIAILCYWLGIDRLFYWLNRNSKRIVTFHNVIPSSLLPQGKKIGLTDTEETFAMKLREIGKNFYFTTDFCDNKGVTITFDDGYRNQYEVASSLMGDTKGVIFACGKLYDNVTPHEALVVDLLMHWTWLVPKGEYIIDYHTTTLKKIIVDDKNRDFTWQKCIWPAFVRDSETKGYGLLKALDAIVSIESLLRKCSKEYLRLRMTGFTLKELGDIRKKGWLVGWHTHEHFPLSALTEDEKLKEIDTLAPDNVKIVPLSYPYGELQSVDTECLEITRNAGFPSAVSNLPNVNMMTGSYFLPRITLSNNKYLLHFELSGVKYFIRNHKRMPIVKV